MTPRQIKRLNTPANLADSGVVRGTGLPPSDWAQRVAKGNVGSDRG